MLRVARIGFALLFFVLSGAVTLTVSAQSGRTSAPAPEKDDVIKLQASLVAVPVIVSDRDGRYFSGLKKEDFKLYEDRNEQSIAVFEATEEPIQVVLLLDTSRSTHRVLDGIQDAAKSFLKHLRPQDRAMIVSFDYDVHVLCNLTADRKRLEHAIQDAEIGQYVGTTLRDAIAEVMNRHFKKVDGRKAIILLTDGKDHGSAITEDQLLDDATEAGVMIYPIYYETGLLLNGDRNRPFPFPRGRRDRPGGRRRFPALSEPAQNQDRRNRRIMRNEEAIDFLTELADVSAGRFYQSETGNLKETFKRIADELRHQYLLGFYPDAKKMDGKHHPLKVEVARPGAVVRARRSYIAAHPDKPQN